MERKQQIAMLLQGASLPSAASCSAEPLLPALDQPSSPPSPPPVEHDFQYPETRYMPDTSRRATGAVTCTSTLGLTTATTTTTTATDTTMDTSTAGSTDILTNITAVVPVPPHPVPAAACNVMVSPVLLQQQQSEPVTVSRTTVWRRAKEEQAALDRGDAPAPKKPRRAYKCSKCNRPMAGK